MTQTTPHDLLARWDHQQSAYIAHRDDRFAAMMRVLNLALGTPAPRILDLACGPGSLTAALIENIDEATVVAVDKDPVLLAIAHDTVGQSPYVTVLDTDLAELDDPQWSDPIDLPTVNAVVSSTALHWLHPAELTRLYIKLASELPPGSIFLNADHLSYDAISSPTLSEIAAQDDQDVQAWSFEGGTDSWDDWWSAAESHPAYAGAAIERNKRWADKESAPPKVSLDFHLAALRSAGFNEVGTVWQYFDDYVVFACM